MVWSDIRDVDGIGNVFHYCLLCTEGMAQPAENVKPQVTQCEHYNRTQCPIDNPHSSLCKKKTISCDEWDDPGKINQCYVVWSNLSGTVSYLCLHLMAESLFTMPLSSTCVKIDCISSEIRMCLSNVKQKYMCICEMGVLLSLLCQ